MAHKQNPRRRKMLGASWRVSEVARGFHMPARSRSERTLFSRAQTCNPRFAVESWTVARSRLRGTSRGNHIAQLAVCHGALYVCMSSAELHTLFQAFTAA